MYKYTLRLLAKSKPKL